MSPLTVVVCAALVSVTCAGLLPSGRSEYKLAVNYHSEQEASARQLVSSSSQLEQPQSGVSENVEVIPEGVKTVEEVDTEESATPLPEANPSEDTASDIAPETTPAEPTAETQQSPLVPSAVSRVSSSSSSGALSYAYHGETQHESSSSSRISQTLTSNVPAYPPQPSELHFTPDVHHVTFYHPEQLQGTGQVVAVTQADHPQYLQHDRPRVLATHGATILTPAGAAVTTYEAAPATIAHFTPVQRQPVREQAFSVNVASAKYGYGYTVRGIQHAHPQ